MSKGKTRKLIAILLLAASVALIVVGVFGVQRRTGQDGIQMLQNMRVRAVLKATGEGAVESYVAIAKAEAKDKARAEGASMSELRDIVAAAEQEARANSSGSVVDLDAVDTTPINAAVISLEDALVAYYQEEALAKAAYIEQMQAQQASAGDAVQETAELDSESMSEDDMALDSGEPQVDMSDFQATEQMNARMAVVDERYLELGEALKGVYTALDDNAIQTLQKTVQNLVYQSGDDYGIAFDRLSAAGGAESLAGSAMSARIIRYGDDLITIGVALIILALLLWFYPVLLDKLGLPRLIIGMFFVLLCVLSVLYDLSISTLLSNTIVRMGMNSILVLAMVPAIQCGISLNLGLPLGIVGGLLGGLMCIEFGMSGWPGFLFAIASGSIIAAVVGYLYGLLLNRLKGSEMAVTTYVGYSVVSLMCIAWLLLPFTSPALRWPLGKGLRVTLSMTSSYKHILNDLWSFKIGSIVIPTGLLLFMGLCCLAVWLFSRSKTGIAMQAAGNNPRFCEATGINVNKMRIVGTVLSTVLGAVGIIVYSQSYGFMQLYTAPRQMGFIAASAILIGGASISRARISHVLIGTFLFQGVLTLGMPVANVLVPQSTISETMRILISNGIILYALTKSGGGSRA